MVSTDVLEGGWEHIIDIGSQSMLCRAGGFSKVLSPPSDRRERFVVLNLLYLKKNVLSC